MNKYKKYVFLIIYILITSLIFFFSLRNGEQSTGDSSFLTSLLYNVIKILKLENIINVNSLSSIVRKLIGHFGLFFICGFFGYFTYCLFIENYKFAIIINLIIGLLISIISELLQLIPINRSCQLSDVVIDFSGYFICTLILVFIKYLIIKKQLKN